MFCGDLQLKCKRQLKTNTIMAFCHLFLFWGVSLRVWILADSVRGTGVWHVSSQPDLLLWRGAHSRCETLGHLMALFSNAKLCSECFSNHTGSGNNGITSPAQRFTVLDSDECRMRRNTFSFPLRGWLLVGGGVCLGRTTAKKEREGKGILMLLWLWLNHLYWYRTASFYLPPCQSHISLTASPVGKKPFWTVLITTFPHSLSLGQYKFVADDGFHTNQPIGKNSLSLGFKYKPTNCSELWVFLSSTI